MPEILYLISFYNKIVAFCLVIDDCHLLNIKKLEKRKKKTKQKKPKFLI